MSLERVWVELEKLKRAEREVEEEFGSPGVSPWIYYAFMSLREKSSRICGSSSSRVFVEVGAEKDTITVGGVAVEGRHAELLPALLKLFGEVCLRDYGEGTGKSVTVGEVLAFLRRKLEEKRKEYEREARRARRGERLGRVFARYAEKDVVCIEKAIEFLQHT